MASMTVGSCGTGRHPVSPALCGSYTFPIKYLRVGWLSLIYALLAPTTNADAGFVAFTNGPVRVTDFDRHHSSGAGSSRQMMRAPTQTSRRRALMCAATPDIETFSFACG